MPNSARRERATFVDPTYSNYVDASRTLGPEVGDLCRLANFGPDPEQQAGLDQIFAVNARGKSKAFEFAVVAPRQNLKTGLLKQAALGFLYLQASRLIVWSAHEFATAQEAFRDMIALVESSPDLRREVKAIRRGNGDEAIELTNGARLIFKARTKGGGRGLSGDKVILDEAFALRDFHMGALLPTLSARPDPQILYGSSAGLADSSVLRSLRDRGRAGKDRRLSWLEWSDPAPGGCEVDGCDHVVGVAQGCALDDEARWAAVNTALGRRITLETLRAFRRSMPPSEFAREFLGWWDEPADGDPSIDLEAWLARESDAEPSGALFWALDVAPGHAAASAWVCGNGVLEKAERRPGSAWLPEWAAQRQDMHSVAAFLVDPSGPIGALIPDFERLGVRLRLLDGKETTRACEAITAAVAQRGLAHRGEPELLTALGSASRRTVGDGWKWSRKDSRADISPLVAATWAFWGYLDRDAQANRPSKPGVFFI